MSVLHYPREFDPGIMGGWATGNNHLIPGDIPTRCRERGRSRGGGRKGRIRDGIPEDAVADVAQVPHLVRSKLFFLV